METWSDDTINSAIELASTVINAGLSVHFGVPFGLIAGAISSLGGAQLKDRLERRRVERIFEQCGDVVAQRILKILSQEYSSVPENERTSAILAVRDTLRLAKLTPKKVIILDLDPNRIRMSLQKFSPDILREAGLSQVAAEFYHRILTETGIYIVDFVETLPQSTAQSIAELLRRETQIHKDLELILGRLPATRSVEDYAADYQRSIIRKLDRMELFGVDIDTASRRYPLNVAYVSLQVLRNPQVRPTSTGIRMPSDSSHRVDRVLGPLNRIILIGEAGTGKTTLLRWLAVSSAIGAFSDGLEAWNHCVPFLITLRDFAQSDLPKPQDFPSLVAPSIAAEIPASWPHNLLREGKALLLVDGVDELPEGEKRDIAQDWLADLVETYPDARYVVTSRPAAIRHNWPDSSFAVAELQPMSPDDVEVFIERWYRAVENDRAEIESDELEAQRRALVRAIETDGNLRRLAVNPLLCALICALNRSRRGELPNDRMGIYRAALEMFLGRRDRERRIESNLKIAPEIQLVLLQELAFWLIRQNLTTVSMRRAEDLVGRVLTTVSLGQERPSAVLRFMLERTGLLREPVQGQVDFVHRTFQDYLAGRAAAEGDEIELLIANVDKDNWRDVVIFAAGHCQLAQRERLFNGLIAARKNYKGSKMVRVSLLTVACLITVSQLDPALREAVGQIARELVPPRTLEAAEDLSAAGDLVLEVLSVDSPQNNMEAMASIRLASKIGGPQALRIIAGIGAKFGDVQSEIMRAQRAFDPLKYAKVVLKHAKFESLTIDDMSILPYIEFLGSLISLELDPGDLFRIPRLGNRPPNLTSLIVRSKAHTSLAGIEQWIGLKRLMIYSWELVPDLYPLSQLESLQSMVVTVARSKVAQLNLRPLIALRNLEELVLDIDATCDIDLNIFAGRSAPLRLIISSEVRTSRCPNSITIVVRDR